VQQGLFFPAFDGVADPHRLVELAQLAESTPLLGVPTQVVLVAVMTFGAL
jgi:hypothetical protein